MDIDEISRPVKRKPLMVLAASAVVLVISGAAILWGKTRIFPDLLDEATAAYSRGEWDRTVSLVRRRLKEVPDDPRALRLAARAAAHKGQDQKAIAIYQRLRAVDKEAEDFSLLGRARIRLGQVDSACREYEQARQKEPDHPAALATLAALYLRSDRYHAAEEAARRLARQPEWEARAQSLLGTALAETHDAAGASQALLRWRQLDPRGEAAAPDPAAVVRKHLVRSLLMSGKPAEARTILQAMLAGDQDPEVSWLFSRAFIQEGSWKQAAGVLPQDPSFRNAHPQDPEPAPYVGEARCAECHRRQFHTLLASRHATSFTLARELGRLPLPAEPLSDPGNPQVTHRFRRADDSVFVETRSGQKVWHAVLDYAFGSSDRYTTFVGRDDQSRPLMIRMSYYRSSRGTGWDISTGLPPRPDEDEEYLGKRMVAGDGTRRCLNCHTTNFYSIVNGVGPEAADHSIGCERCHGPGGHHVAAVTAGFPDLAIAAPAESSPSAINLICAQCHGYHQADSSKAPRTDPHWLRYHSLTLTWSRCFTEANGRLSCITCHDPHGDAKPFTALDESKCLSCHEGFPKRKGSANPLTTTALRSREDDSRDGTAARCPINSSRGCVDCHMPRIWDQSTHSFKTDHFIRVHDRHPT